MGFWEIWSTGYLYGIGFFIALFYWLPRLSPENLVYRWIMWPSLLLTGLYLGIYVGIAFVLGSIAARRGRLSVAIVLPAAWVLMEWVRAQGVLGFPWGTIAYALADAPVTIQTVDLFGLFGLSWIVTLTAALAVLGRGRSRIVAGALVGLLLVYGGWRLGESPAGDTCDVALIQPNFSAAEKWDPENREAVFSKCLRQSSVAVQEPADLIVWPETATPFRLRHSRSHLWRLGRWIEKHETPVLTGTPDVDEIGDEFLHFNAAYLFKEGAGDTLRYIKRQLVPFSEWLPWRFLRIMEINFGQADFTPGTSAEPLAFGDHEAGILICIEAIFPRLARAAVREGADMLVNITNDVWFGDSPAPYQHAKMAIFRAVELRRPLVRCANTGISMFVDRAGRVRESLGTFVSGTLRAEIRPERTETLYAKTGDWIVAICAGLVLVGLVGPRRRGI